MDDPWIKTNRGPLGKALEAVRAHVGELIVEVVPPEAQSLVTINGRVRYAGKPTRVPEGSSLVQVEADGYEPARRTVDVPGRAIVRESIALNPLPTPAFAAAAAPVLMARPPPPRVAPRAPRSSLVRTLLVAGGATGALVGGYLVYLDDTGTCGMGSCPSAHSTLTGGGLLLGSSVAVAVLGLVLVSR